MSRELVWIALAGLVLACGKSGENGSSSGGVESRGSDDRPGEQDPSDATVPEQRPHDGRPLDGGTSTASETEGPSDAADVAEPADSAPGQEPPSVALPPGKVVSELQAERISSMAVDLAGTLWVVSQCQGVYALAEGELHHYGWVDTGLPERADRVVVDGVNRKWFPDYRSITLLDGTDWSVVAEGEFFGGFSVAADGSAWLEDTTAGALQNVAPGLEYEVVPPEPVSSFAAVGARQLWAVSGSEVRYFDDGEWSEPVTVSEGWGIQYDPAHDIAWLESNEPALLRWSDGQIDVEPIAELPVGWFTGFDAEGRMVRASDSAVSWMGVSGVEETAALSQFADTPYSTLDFGSNVLLVERDYSPAAIFRLEPPDLRNIQPITAFQPDSAYPWRSAGYPAALEASSVDVGAEQLEPLAPELIGEKIHLVGYLESGFESSSVNIDGESFDYWVDVASDFSTFANAEGWDLVLNVEGPSDDAGVEVEEWDLFGYIELGACFGHLGSSSRQFWVVEAYPRSMPEAERAVVRERLAAAAQN